MIRHLKWKLALGFQRCSTEQWQSQLSYPLALLLSKGARWETICHRGLLAEELKIPIYNSETWRSLEKCSSSLLTRAKVGFNFPYIWKPKSSANTTLHCLHSEIAKLHSCTDRKLPALLPQLTGKVPDACFPDTSNFSNTEKLVKHLYITGSPC